MSKILVVYATTDGHTAKVAREIGVRLRDCGADARVMIASRDLEGPEEYDGVIVAASVHAGRYQANVRRWIERHGSALGKLPSAFVSVCLMVRDPKAAPKLAALMSGFLDSCHWTPSTAKPVAGALRYTRYGWLKRWIMKRIAARTGGDTDTSRDHEYTDWDDLQRFTTGFCRAVEARRPALQEVA
jgi:menaquinone-dependent protoporphyrinogen oxidase